MNDNENAKNTASVVIDGKIYSLYGAESEVYMHEVAAYLNQKILDIKKNLPNYSKLDDGMKSLLLEINICDDLFQQKKETRKIRKEQEDDQRESYSARHDLVNMQMKLESALKELEGTQRKLAEAEARLSSLKARDRAFGRPDDGADREIVPENREERNDKVSMTIKKMLN